MTAMIDTSSTVEIELGRAKMITFVFVCLALVAVCWWMAFDPASRPKHILAGWVGIPVSGGLAVLALTRLFAWRGPILTVSPHGVRYRHFAAKQVSWNEVTAISEWKYLANRSVMLSLAPGVEGVSPRGFVGRLLRGPRPVGVHGMLISAGDLRASYEDIRNLITAFAKAHANLDLTPSSRLARQS